MIELFKWFIDFVLHIDQHLVNIVSDYQTWTYAILALIVFCETGLVVTPFLPGDSLLFAAGAVAAMQGSVLSVPLLIIIIFSAAFIGDNTNYFIGRAIGQNVYDRNYKLIKRKYLLEARAFYEKHGGKTVILSRFMPIIRTFTPFVAGVAPMEYKKFIGYSLVANTLWVNIFCIAGYVFGNIPTVKRNFEIVIFSIIIISLIPPVFTFAKQYFKKSKPEEIA